MINRCSNCHWWGLRLDEDDEGYRFGMAGGESHKPCEHPKVGGGSYNDETRCGPDGLNSLETVGTGPDFGCIHWEKA